MFFRLIFFYFFIALVGSICYARAPVEHNRLHNCLARRPFPVTPYQAIADTLKSKFKLSSRGTNHYSEVESSPYRAQVEIAAVTEDRAEKVLLDLRSDSATGPDQLPSRIIKECAKQLAKPFCMLAKLILVEGRWSELWTIHFIVPLHKKTAYILH